MARQSQIIQPSQEDLLKALMAGQGGIDTSAAVEGTIRGEDLSSTILKNKQAQEDRIKTLAEKIRQAKLQKDLANTIGAENPTAGLAAQVDPTQASKQKLEQYFTERSAKLPKPKNYTKVGETADEIIMADLANPADQYRIKAQGVGAKAGGKGGDPALAKDRVRKRADIILAKTADALKKTSGWTTGGGGLLAKVPATSARNLKGVLDTIKANLGFAELEQMRQSSPTGGALGQIAVKELDFLQSVEGSLDQLQSQEEVEGVIKDIQASYQRIRDAIDADNQGGTPGIGGQTPPAGNPGQNEVKRRTKDGKIAIFDGNTKQFLRYEE